LTGVVVVVLLIGSMAATVVRNSDYASPVSFWLREIAAVPHNPKPYNELTMALIGRGRFGDAEPVARAALWVQTHRAPPPSDLGDVDPFGLVPVRDRRGHALTHTYLGIICEQTGRAEDGVRHYRRAIAVDPSIQEAHRNLANLLARMQASRSSARGEAVPGSVH